MHIIALIVTNNRLNLLKEAVDAVRAQSLKPNQVIVLNNGSTDGTKEWLDQQKDLHVIHQANLGCSDGFATGFKEACRLKADWIWAMDDDTIPAPEALSKLVSVAVNPSVSAPIGFACSRVEWSDGSPHLMNLPHISIFNKQGIPYSQYDNIGALLVNSCSWVSFLVSTEAVKRCGLPRREFNIWGDDMEYTQRLTKNGFLGFYVPGSIVHHKTPSNYSADIFTDNDKSIWKFRYGIRNHLFMVREQKGFMSYFGKLLKHFFIMPVKVMKKRKSHQGAFIRMIWTAAWSSIFFNPGIEYIQSPDAH